MQTKICTKCGEEKELTEFNKNKRGKFGTRSNCKLCHSEYQKQYRQENRESIREYRKLYDLQRYQSNPHYKIPSLIRTRTWQLIQSGKAKKFCGYNDYIGCTPQELVEHLESQFHECPSTGQEMDWDNHGEWHIDHIRPLASFDLLDEDEFMQAHHYTNLQPLWAEENLSKGATWDEQEA